MLPVAAQDGSWHRAHTAKTKHSSTWAELPQAGQENSLWKEGAAEVSPAVLTPREMLPKRGMASRVGQRLLLVPRDASGFLCLRKAELRGHSPAPAVPRNPLGMEEAVAVPQEPLPALCCIPEPQLLPTEPSRCSFWSGIEWHLVFPTPPFLCVSESSPRAFHVPLRVLEASEHVHCTPKFSFCLSLHPRALPGPSSTSGN